MISSNIFNIQKTDYVQTPLFFGERSGMFDTINKQYPEIWKIYKEIKSLDWDENEFVFSSCLPQFKTCDPLTRDVMIKTLTWQWETDSIVSRISPLVGCVVSSSELWAAYQRLSDQECVHSATYSEIVRNSFENPKEILDQILQEQESFKRLTTVARVMDEAYIVAHQYALGQIEVTQEVYNKVFMFVVALLFLEGIQFMASFAVTFSICDTGLFRPIGNAVQKIAQDEQVHVKLEKEVIRTELRTERGRIAFEQCKPLIVRLANELIASESSFIRDFLFVGNRQIVGMNADYLEAFMLWCAKDICGFMGIKPDGITFPKHNPLKFMEFWLNISKTQSSPQEEDMGKYKVNLLRRDDDDVVFDI